MLKLNLFFFAVISIAQLSAHAPSTSVIKNSNPKMFGPPHSKQDKVIPLSNFTEFTTRQETEAREQLHESNCKELEHFIGSNLFDGDRKICFSHEDVNILAARRQFELAMMPRDMTPTVLNDKSVCVIMRYFCYGHLLIRRLKDCGTSRVLKKAFFDAFGGFMHHYLLPVVKISFYVGDIRLKTVRKVLNYYQKCRFFLNTNGNGWRTPLNFPLDSLNNISFKSISMNYNSACDIESEVDYCIGLDLLLHNLNDDVDENMIVALPKLEFENNDGLLCNIWLPFTRKSTFNLRSFKSSFILVGFYKKVSQCYRQKRIPQGLFDKKFRKWIAENILPHLNDEEFYPSLGGLIGLYKYLEKSDEHYTSEQRNMQEHTEVIASKRDINKIQRKRTSEYNNLSKKVKGADECEMNWLPEINQISGTKEKEKNKKGKKKNTKKKGKKKKKKHKKKKKIIEENFDEQEEDESTKASKDAKENKKGVIKDDKKNKKKSFFKWNWRKWFGLSGNSTSTKNKTKNAKKKKSFFNWSWPKWFDSPNLNWSLQWGWLKLLKELLKYGILLLVGVIIFCVLFKLISLVAGILCGVGGSLGGDCFGVIMNLIFGFLKNLLQVLAVLFTGSFATLCSWCGKAANSSQPYRRDFEKSALPEIRIYSEPSSSKGRKRKKSGKTDHSDVSEKHETTKTATKTEAAKKEEEEVKTGRKSRSRSRPKRRFRGGQSCMESDTPTDSSPSSEEKTSWQTFYDF